MFSKWIKRKKVDSVMGLEIGSGSLKLLKLDNVDSACTIRHFAITPLPPNVIVNDEIKDYDAMSAALRTIIKQAGAETNLVALSIPRSSVIIKNTLIDSRLTARDIESRVWIEANRHFPDLVGEIYLDYYILGPSEADSTQLDLMLVACRKEQIKPYLDVLRQTGLTAKIVDVDCYALQRALARMLKVENAPQKVALINIDFSLSSLIVTEGENLLYAHDHTYDGHKLITQVRDFLNTEKKGLLEEPGYLELLKENLSAHLRHTMHFFYSSRPNIAIQKLYIAGDVAIIPSLVPFLQKETGIETELANPFLEMKISRGIDKEALLLAAPTLALCCGLALSKVAQYSH